MSSSSDDPNDDNKKHTEKRSSAMFMYIRDFLFFFAVGFTSYATLFNRLPKVGKPPLASPFFPSSSVVADYYRGSMDEAFEEAVQADFAMLMYYAPWDAESQAARPVFDSVARQFREEVYFAAISCWSPSSECKQHYSKIRSFPVIVVYPPRGVGIQYRGPIVEGYMVRFLESILRPVRRVRNEMDILQLLTTHSSVVMGSFLFEGNVGGRGYFTFYSAALKTLERDFNNDIAFAVTTNAEDANALQVQELPSIRMFLWNETHEFPLDAEYTVDAVANWAWQKSHQVAQWASPPGSKATTLSQFVTSRATLMVFTPGHPTLPAHPVFSLVKGLALRYNVCFPWGTPYVEEMDKLTQNIHRNNQRLELKCLRLKQEERAKKMEDEKMTSTVISSSAIRNRSGCNSCQVGSSFLGPQLEVCVRPLGYVSANKSSTIRYDTSMWNNEKDSRGPVALLSKHEKRKCRLLELPQDKVYFPKLNSIAEKSVDGLSCITNRTLNFVVLDSHLHYQFAEGIGVNLISRPEKTVAVIVDPKAESQYVLNEPLTEASLSAFIINYTSAQLERHLRTTADTDVHPLGKHRYGVRSAAECVHTESEACVVELTSDNFLSTVLDPTKAVIVLYHSPFCAMCRSIAHVFLLLSRYFRHFPVVKLARIDGENNDLPWQYAMDSYPSILFFPVTNKEESRVYSDNLPFTVRNVMHFILANLQAEAKVSAMFYLCANFEKLQTEEEARNCKSKVMAQVQESLSKSLNKMRLVLARLKEVDPESSLASALFLKKSRLMLSLQFFRSVSFVIGAVDRTNYTSREVLDLYQRFLRTSELR